jgi:hypothetical protein
MAVAAGCGCNSQTSFCNYFSPSPILLCLYAVILDFDICFAAVPEEIRGRTEQQKPVEWQWLQAAKISICF